MPHPLLSLFLLLPTLAAAADLHLHLLDGRTGAPIAHTHVVILGDNSLLQRFTTDAAGSLTLNPGHATAFRIFVDGRHPCAPSPTPPIAVATVRSPGLVSPNTCSATVTTAPTPDTLTLYLRPESPAEKAAD